jgi:hypothetical protein
MTDKCCPTPESAPIPNVQPVEWCAGNKVLRWADGRITETPKSPLIPDGVYTNATIRTVDGCIVEILEGTNVVYSACDPCAVPAPPPVNGQVAISGESCNLTSFDQGGALLTLFYAVSSDCITVQGCGTSFSPLIPSIRVSTDPNNIVECRSTGLYVPAQSGPGGVNSVGCGIEITNGLITALPLPFQPLLDLTSADGSVVLTRSVDGCSFNLAVAENVPDISAGGGIVSVYDNSGQLQDPPTQPETFAIVGVANPRQLWVFIANVGWRQIFDSTSSSLQVNV